MPYHDGLFFFDTQVPPNYPASPTSVYYHSFGLLNTWNGHKYQKWNPSKSTILQVLVSNQGLVLNITMNLKGALRYNEHVFIMCCKTMLFILNRPHKSFEDFVNKYFCNRASAILVSCNVYINDQAEIGDPINITAATKTTTSLTSFTFKEAAEYLHPRLVDSFIKNGSSLESIELLDTSKNMR
ncbi:hypothetical protein MKX01_002065 [Papaver californicum]|nr:hypothetical protein MKX01_002065 [Papaver californicum]